MSEEQKLLISKSLIGKNVSEETKQKMSAAKIGKLPPNHRNSSLRGN